MGEKNRKKTARITDVHRRVYEQFPAGMWTELQLANRMGMGRDELRAVLEDLEALGVARRMEVATLGERTTGTVRMWRRVEGASLPAPEEETPPEAPEASHNPDPEVPAALEASPDPEDPPEAPESSPDPEDSFAEAEVTRELLDLIWPDLLERAGRRDLSLRAILASSRIGDVEGSMITLILPNPAMRDRLQRMKGMLEEALEDALGLAVQVHLDLDPAAEAARREAPKVLSEGPAGGGNGSGGALSLEQVEEARKKVIAWARQQFPGACIDAVVASSRIGDVEGRAITLILPNEIIYERFQGEMHAIAQMLFEKALGGPVTLRCMRPPRPPSPFPFGGD